MIYPEANRILASQNIQSRRQPPSILPYPGTLSYIKLVMLKLPYTSSLYIFGLLHQSCCTEAPTYVPPYIKPVMPRLLHHHSIPTSSLLCSGSYIIPAMARSQHAPTDIMPVMPRPLHYNPTPTSSLLCSGSYNNPTIPKPLHMFYPTSACYAQAPTLPPQSYIKPVMCPGSYIKPTMLRIQHMLHPTLSLLCSSPYIHQAGSYIKPVMHRPQPMLLPDMKPVMPRPLHQHPSPISSLSCSNSYIMPAMVRPQHVPTDIMPVMPRSLHHYPSPTSSLIRSGLHIKPPRASRLCSGSNDTKPNTHHKHPKIPSGIGSRHLTPPISPRWV